jgi:hypothetical protein
MESLTDKGEKGSMERSIFVLEKMGGIKAKTCANGSI